MAVTRTFAAGSQQFYQQIDRIIKSHSLRGSESLCKLLQYLAKQSVDHPDAPLKEYQIATEVYGRHADFDPQSDSTIRVQAGRLRLKLAEYYASEGAGDSIVVKIPKGSYHLMFEAKPGEPQPIMLPPVSPVSGTRVEVPVRWRVALVTLLACLIVAVVMLLSLLWTRKQADAAASLTIRTAVVRTTGRVLEALYFCCGRALGHFQQCRFYWTSRNWHALLQFRAGLQDYRLRSLHGCGRGARRPLAGRGLW